MLAGIHTGFSYKNVDIRYRRGRKILRIAIDNYCGKQLSNRSYVLRLSWGMKRLTPDEICLRMFFFTENVEVELFPRQLLENQTTDWYTQQAF